MEELLNKDIFCESDLLKLNPDFHSQDIYLRLQFRRDMVKDSHNHRKLTTDETTRKLQYKTYNNKYYKENTEIAKIHSLFRKKDAINKLTLKKYKIPNKIKMKPDINKIRPNDVDDVTLLQKEMCAFVLNEDDMPDLSVENGTDFKILPKLRPKSPDDRRHCKQRMNIDLSSNLNVGNTILDKNRSVNTIKDKTTISTYTNPQECCENNFSPQNNDLQSLLIMMTISSQYNEKNDQYSNDEKDSRKEQKTYENNLFTDTQTKSYEIKKKQISDILSVHPFKRTFSEDRNKQLIKKYVNKWKSYVKMKTENKIQHRRKETLNMFLDKITKAKCTINEHTGSIQKAKVVVRDYNSYHHRYKVQKNIIALQKAQLEQKNKIIEELKYNKIIEASQKSLDSMKEEVRKTYYEIDKHLKPRIKLLTNELNIKEIEEPSLVLHCLKVPQFLQRMEARAREREERHAIIRERRKQMEQEKIRLKQQAELEKAEMNKEEKIKRIAELKEKRKREKIENIRKKQHSERLRALIVMADLHYERSLILKYGLRPFQILLQIKRDNIERAQNHYKFQLMKNVFLNWMFYTEDMWFERHFKAQEFYRKKLLKNAFQVLKNNHYSFILKKQVAEDYYDLYVTQLVFRKFRDGVKISKEEFALKWMKAMNYHNCNLLFKTFTCWRTLPALNALKREQEVRKLKWREKVLQVVPDYKPPDD